MESAFENRVEKLSIGENVAVRDAMRVLDRGAEKILFVIGDKGQLVGSLSDGDIRRWILRDGNLLSQVALVCNRNPLTATDSTTPDQFLAMMSKFKISVIPIVDSDQRISEIRFLRDLDASRQAVPKTQISAQVVIMAGGKGTRLEPFTRILPKPLIPIGEKPIIEIILDKFREHGCKEFYVSVNYKSKMIKAFFEDLEKDFILKFIDEEAPLGTVGSLNALVGELNKPFFVTNCDIIVESDYAEIYNYHVESNNDITIVACMKRFHIPYGVCQIKPGGELTSIVEKPEYNYLINAGMYVLSPSVLLLIPKDTHMHITELMENVRKNGGKVRVFPIGDSEWLDVGEWAEYKKTLTHFA